MNLLIFLFRASGSDDNTVMKSVKRFALIPAFLLFVVYPALLLVTATHSRPGISGQRLGHKIWTDVNEGIGRQKLQVSVGHLGE